MADKLGDSELKVMGVLWDEGEATAKHISTVMTERYGWNINTTYSLLKRCIKKGAVERREPHFLCRALVTREEVRKKETASFLAKFFDSSEDKLFAALLGGRNLSGEQVAQLKEMIAEMERENEGRK